MKLEEFAKACFKNDSSDPSAILQGLKPLALSGLFGTTEVVP
jgi:hypothetical protein